MARHWKPLNFLLKSLSESISDLGIFCVVLFIYIFTYSILGMELFAYNAIFDLDNNIDLDNGITI